MSGQRNYEVFLSFRGPDTRRDFADYLYTMLTDVGIRVFRDEEELETGKEIKPQLIQAIEQSKISIPVISEEFASSRSCLMELEKMVDRMDNHGHSIIPIFYYVEPSHVRNCEGCFETPLQGPKKRDRCGTLVDSWKYALKRIGRLNGHHLDKNSEVKHGKFTKGIVREVQQMLKKRVLNVPEHLVGVVPHVQQIMAKLKFDYRNGQAVKIGDTCEKVLICGIPGVGKTVLAKCVYNQLQHLYETCSFLGDIQEQIQNHSIVSLQNRLISNLHNQNAPNFNCPDKALRYIQSWFYNKKVLVVLDDVKDHDQLSALVGKLDMFALGSTVVVTSQRYDVLRNVNGAENYVLRTMKQDNALTLFCKHAFNTDSPLEGFKELATNIAAATDGLPLALKKVGDSLFNITGQKVWKEKLTLLKEAPYESVHAAFFKSYTNLEREEKQIFLEIACFFNGKDKRIPYGMWHDLQLSPSTSILSLKVRSLVEIGENKELCMHEILKKFGREIVKSENRYEAGKRPRLCNREDALDVLTGGKGAVYVEALRRDFADRSKGHFFNLQNLRFLKLDQADIQGTFGDQFSSLRWLHWQGCPKIFDDDISLTWQNLVILDLSWSEVHEHWSGWKYLSTARKLKVLRLTGCVQLTATPTFPHSMGLERLILEGCSNLAVIDQSFGSLTKLVSLNLKQCSLLRELPDLRVMRGLKELVIDKTSISRINFQKRPMMRLTTLSACDCKDLADLSDLFQYLKSLKYLALDSTRIVTLGESIGLLEKLKTLSLKGCQRLTDLPDEIGKLRSLQFLDLSYTRIGELPPSVKNLKDMTVLRMTGTAIREFPKNILYLEKLEEIDFSSCQNLEGKIPEDIDRLSSLAILNLSHTRISAQQPPNISRLSRLREIHISGWENL